jgi:hypothetical protein
VRNVDGKTLYLAVEWCQMAGIHAHRAVMRLAGVRPAISKSTSVMIELMCILSVSLSALYLCGSETPV